MHTRTILFTAAACLAASVLPASAQQQAALAASAPAIENASASAAAPAAAPVDEVLTRDAEGRLSIRAVRVERPPSIDGRLDEEVYDRVPPITGFIQQEPREGEPSTEDAQIWVTFDDSQIYI